VLWLLACVAGLAAVLVVDTTPGSRGDGPPPIWPADTGIARVPGRPTLLLFLHPHCPCSNATVGELERLLVHCSGRVDVRAVFVAPEGTPPGWARTALRDRADRIPGVLVGDDPGGAEARRFRATTSGTALLYGTDGRLRFHGGITLARAHEGDNPGEGAIVALLAGGTPATIETPVFGCPLRNAEPGVGTMAPPDAPEGRLR
jgi:hypothetical protein